MAVSRECPYIGRMCPYLGGACPYLGSVSYEAKLINKNYFFHENLFGSTTALDKVIFGHHLAYLTAMSYYSFKYQNSLYMDTHSLDMDT